MIADVRPITYVGDYVLGTHKAGGWRQWYVQEMDSDILGLVDYSDAAEAGLPYDLHDFTEDDVATMLTLVWREVAE